MLQYELIYKECKENTMKLQIGMPAPEFTLNDAEGKEVSLRDFRGKNVVIAFFPLAWTPI